MKMLDVREEVVDLGEFSDVKPRECCIDGVRFRTFHDDDLGDVIQFQINGWPPMMFAACALWVDEAGRPVWDVNDGVQFDDRTAPRAAIVALAALISEAASRLPAFGENRFASFSAEIAAQAASARRTDRNSLLERAISDPRGLSEDEARTARREWAHEAFRIRASLTGSKSTSSLAYDHIEPDALAERTARLLRFAEQQLTAQPATRFDAGWDCRNEVTLAALYGAVAQAPNNRLRTALDAHARAALEKPEPGEYANYRVVMMRDAASVYVAARGKAA